MPYKNSSAAPWRINHVNLIPSSNYCFPSYLVQPPHQEISRSDEGFFAPNASSIFMMAVYYKHMGTHKYFNLTVGVLALLVLFGMACTNKATPNNDIASSKSQAPIPMVQNTPSAGATSRSNNPDSDGDGLTDTQEIGWGTNHNNIDTDGDSYSDKSEIDSGQNPNGAGELTFEQKINIINKSIDYFPTSLEWQETRNTKRLADIRSVQAGLARYYDKNRSYPNSQNTVLGVGGGRALTEQGFVDSVTGTDTVYLAEIPHDPIPSPRWYRYQSFDGLTYTISFSLEGKASPSRATPEGIR